MVFVVVRSILLASLGALAMKIVSDIIIASIINQTVIVSSMSTN